MTPSNPLSFKRKYTGCPGRPEVVGRPLALTPETLFEERRSCEYATKEGDATHLQGRCSANLHLSEGSARHQSCSYVVASVARMEFRMRTAEGLDPVRSTQVQQDGGIMPNLLETLLREEAAQDLAEYGIALAVIGILAGAAAIVIAKDVGTLWSRAQSLIDNAQSS